MDASPSRHPYRCLPLSMANVYGWTLLSPASFSVHWNGGPEASDIRFQSHDGFAQLGRYLQSNFADGIVTFHTGYIFRTEPGWDLLVTGPMNQPKDGISPLSGVVETDWLPYTFTMNWQMTRPGVVRFEKDEPFCQLVPVAKHVLEETQPEILDLESNPELTQDFRMWREERDWFRVSARAGNPEAMREGWQKFYFHGELPSGKRWTDDHTRKLRLPVPIDLRTAQQGAFAGDPSDASGTAGMPAEAAVVRAQGYQTVPGGRIWHRVVGSGTGTPLLVLPGGFGFPHDHLESLAALGDDRTVVFFDPLGCGRSDRASDARLWTAEHFGGNVASLRAALGLKQLHLLGHGFGAAQAVEQWHRNAQGIRSLVLASPCLSMADWTEGMASAVRRLPQPLQDMLSQGAEPTILSSELFQSAVRAYFRQALCRREPWPHVLERTMAGIGPEMYVALWGPNPMSCTGALRTYNARALLDTIKVPTLLTCGALDIATPTSTEALGRKIANAELAVFTGSSHTPHLEEPAAYLATLRDFLRRADV
jgi:proline-specific peptidase